MVFVCRGSHKKIVHTCDCRYAKTKGENEKISFGSMRMATDAGYVPCRVCAPVKKIFESEKDKLGAFCKTKEVHFFYNAKEDTLDIVSKSGKWKIIADDTTKVLFCQLFFVNRNTF